MTNEFRQARVSTIEAPRPALDRSATHGAVHESTPERFDTVIIGGGQAGLSTGYHLARRGVPHVILDASDRIGDTWRGRWDSLRLFTPARFSGLDGMRFPASPHHFATKDEMADYLERYAERFRLNVRSGVRVDRLARSDGRFLIAAGDRRIEADNVVIAMADHQRKRVPGFAAELDPSIVQLHSSEYRNPSQLREGPVLIVGAGNSGSEIARELAPGHPVWMSGRDVGQLPFRIAGLAARLILVRLVLRFVFHRVLTVSTPMGRRVRPRVLYGSGPLIRVRSVDLERAGVVRVPRTVGVRGGVPVLEDGRVLDVANIVWCTGFHPGFDWIDLPIASDPRNGQPIHRSGRVESEPGLYFVGLHFLHSMSSEMIHGVGRDAARVASWVAARHVAPAQR
jgi:putative flavoprotein involved in K+ transport